MSELRWNPLLGTYTMVAANRQARPNLQADYCPFCPGSGRVPDDGYTVLLYPNDFPALRADPPPPQPQTFAGSNSPYHTAPAQGACEVILYSPDHHASLWQLPESHIAQVVDLWAQRTAHHAGSPYVRHVFPFENRGEAVGVTMHHPHGQLYAYPFVPQKIEVELTNARLYYETHQGHNLFDALLADELADGRRWLFDNEHFAVFLPFFTDYPYGAFIVAKQPGALLTDLSADQRLSLAQAIKRLTTAFDRLFSKPFPYMMCVHQAPVNTPDAGPDDYRRWYRLHVEFYPPLRQPDRLKYYASSEMGAWAAANTRLVEDTAAELRAVLPG